MRAPVKLRLLDAAPEDMDEWEPGMMWPVKLYDEDSAGHSVVLCRHTDGAGLSWPVIWHTRQRANEAEQGGTPVWTVTGEAPNITVTPSINVIGIWHGWIRNGELVEA